jgi:hypothetical protein
MAALMTILLVIGIIGMFMQVCAWAIIIGLGVVLLVAAFGLLRRPS